MLALRSLSTSVVQPAPGTWSKYPLRKRTSACSQRHDNENRSIGRGGNTNPLVRKWNKKKEKGNRRGMKRVFLLSRFGQKLIAGCSPVHSHERFSKLRVLFAMRSSTNCMCSSCLTFTCSEGRYNLGDEFKIYFCNSFYKTHMPFCLVCVYGFALLQGGLTKSEVICWCSVRVDSRGPFQMCNLRQHGTAL